jgi:hypothetical protein
MDARWRRCRCVDASACASKCSHTTTQAAHTHLCSDNAVAPVKVVLAAVHVHGATETCTSTCTASKLLPNHCAGVEQLQLPARSSPDQATTVVESMVRRALTLGCAGGAPKQLRHDACHAATTRQAVAVVTVRGDDGVLRSVWALACHIVISNGTGSSMHGVCQLSSTRARRPAPTKLF